MVRKAVILTKEELISKLKNYIGNFEDVETNWMLDPYALRKNYKKLDNDLNKIVFDTENIEISIQEFFDEDTKALVGFNTLPNGLTYLGVVAGGDWEIPLFFIIYFDGSTLRGYIPEDGNVFNKLFKTAYGSESEVDFPRDEFNEKDKKVIRETFVKVEKSELEAALKLDMEETLENIFNWADDLTLNEQLIKADIIKRIEIIK